MNMLTCHSMVGTWTASLCYESFNVATLNCNNCNTAGIINMDWSLLGYIFS
jgi:hypothetical protein